MPSSTTSNFYYQKSMDYLLKNTPVFTPPTSLWVSLFTSTPSLDGTGGVEVSTVGTNYARVQILASNGWQGPSGANLEYSNLQELVFGVPSANWGTIVGAGLHDAATAGNLYYISFLTTSKTVSNGDGAPKILAGQMRILRAVCP